MSINWNDETTRRWITGKVARPQEGDPRRCFYVDNASRDEHGHIPMLVTEGEVGYRPMIGATPDGTWYWGDTLDEAAVIADLVNAELFGLTRDESYVIVDSSMNAQNDEDAERQSELADREVTAVGFGLAPDVALNHPGMTEHRG